MSAASSQPYGTFLGADDSPTLTGSSHHDKHAATPSTLPTSADRDRSRQNKELRGHAMHEEHDENDTLEDLSRPRTASSAGSAQIGVQRVEAIAATWSRVGLYIAYLGIALTTWATSLEVLTTVNLTIYATSDFKSHALISTVMVVQGVVLSVVKPPMSKIADVFGRFEAFGLSVLIYVVGYIQQAASRNVETYAAAQLFYSAGQTGLQILIQIFIADTSDLLNRALVVTLPDVPFIVNVWLGPPLANRILQNLGWRWGYGIWAVILPVAFMPLALALCLNQRKAARRGLLPPSPLAGKSGWQIVRTLWFELDVFGLLLICVGFSLLLIPLTVASRTGWLRPGILTMLACGLACLIAFPFWERNSRLAPRAFFPRTLFRNRTVLAGLTFAFFYFMAFYLSVFPYFQSYLIVVRGLSVAEAGHIVQIFTFSATITSILVSLLIKYTKRYRIYVTIGASLYLLGLIMMLMFRTEEASLASMRLAQILLGVGGGMCHGPAQLGVQASASHRDVAAATAAFLTLLEIGGAVGSAISGAIWSASVPTKLAAYLPPETQDRAQDIFGDVKLAAKGWPMGSPTRDAINLAYQETMTSILYCAVLAALPCVFLSLVMKDYKLDEIDQHVKGVVIGQQNPTIHPESSFVTGSSSRLLDALDDESSDENDEGNFSDNAVEQDARRSRAPRNVRAGSRQPRSKSRKTQSIRMKPSTTSLQNKYSTIP